MKISKSKQELARIISENGGWRDGAEFAWFQGKLNGRPCREVWFGKGGSDPEYVPASGSFHSYWSMVVDKFPAPKFDNWQQTILSLAEYFHLYPAPDADGWIEFDGTERPSGYFNVMINVKLQDGRELTDLSSRFELDTDGGARIISYRPHKQEQSKPEFCESVMRSIPEPEAKPTIEQLASDYRNTKDYAERKQQEADDAKADADASLKALELAGEELGLLVLPITEKQEPKLVITDWRDLQVGDEVELTKLNGGGVDVGDVGVIRHVDINSMNVDFPSQECHLISRYSTKWKFIRRP